MCSGVGLMSTLAWPPGDYRRTSSHMHVIRCSDLELFGVGAREFSTLTTPSMLTLCTYCNNASFLEESTVAVRECTEAGCFEQVLLAKQSWASSQIMNHSKKLKLSDLNLTSTLERLACLALLQRMKKAALSFSKGSRDH